MISMQKENILIPKQLKHKVHTQQCTLSTVTTDALVLMHQGISSHSADKIFIVLDQFHSKIQSNPVISRAVNSRKSVSRACTLDSKF